MKLSSVIILLRNYSEQYPNIDPDVIVRGEGVIADISDIYVDTDHSDDSLFISIDIESGCLTACGS